VQSGDPVGIVEVMKLFNTINAGVAGTIDSILAENGQMVEQDDVLFVVRVDA
jgi:acetyl-CoA carboxylase biotin carboxyl carrier protein